MIRSTSVKGSLLAMSTFGALAKRTLTTVDVQFMAASHAVFAVVEIIRLAADPVCIVEWLIVYPAKCV